MRAPFDGQMSRHLIDIGNMVGETAQSAALAQITQLDPIYVVANISSQQALDIRANLDQRRLSLEEIHKVPIEAALTDEKGFPHKGTLEYVAPQIDASTGTLYLRGIMENPTRTLLPGAFVKVRIPMGKVTKSALLIPQTALQEDQGGQLSFSWSMPATSSRNAMCSSARPPAPFGRSTAASTATTRSWSANSGALRQA